MKSIKLSLLVACVCCFFSCTVQDSEIISLENGWVWAVGQKDEEPKDIANKTFAPLSTEKKATLESLLQTGEGYIWLRNDFSVQPNFSKKRNSIFLGRITMADETYLDGTYIGGAGRFPELWWSEWNLSRMYTLDSQLLAPNLRHSLLIKVYVNNEGALTGKQFIGSRALCEYYFKNDMFINSTINFLCAFLMIIIAGYHLLIYIKRKNEVENLYFALMSFLAALYLSNFYIALVPYLITDTWSYTWFQKLATTSILPLITFLFGSFVVKFLQIKENKFVFFARVLCMVLPLFMMFFVPDYKTLKELRLVSLAILVPPLFYTLTVVIAHALTDKIKRIRSDARVLLWGVSPLFICAMLDIFLHSVFKLDELPYLSGLGFPLVILSFLFILAGRFVKARTEAEDLNEHLEGKVVERTKELAVVNENLSSTLENLESAQQVAERDMRMAEYVQASFYPQVAPLSNEWEIAFSFKPMSGVAGDLYDFYEDEGSVSGVGLFDVSGHGIASGLVAMLAKSIIHRNFASHKNKKLSEILEAINLDLIQEKGDIENYLTGILLRFKGNIVEYVNAGHTELLYKKAETGKALEVNYSDRDFKSRFLGIEGLANDFEQIRFRVKKGDAVILYSDCIVESANQSGEDYGYERLKNIISNSPADSAQSLLKAIVNSHTQFMGKEKLNDDFTLIVLVRNCD